MPTKWNLVSQMDNVASLREATEVFSQYDPLLTLPESTPGSIPLIPSAEQSPEISFPDGPSFFLARFGRRPAQALPDRSSEAALQSLSLGQAIDHGTGYTALPESLKALSPGALWPPVRFYLHLVRGTSLGKPVIAESSGFTDWDQALQAYIGSSDYYRSLGSGYYRITVYP
jgi:hypothetical protein